MIHVNVLCVNEDWVKTAPWPASVVIPHPLSHWDETGSQATTYSYCVVTMVDPPSHLDHIAATVFGLYVYPGIKYHWPSQENNLGHLAMKFKYPVSFIGPHNFTGKASRSERYKFVPLLSF